MCGICGQFNFTEPLPVVPEDIARMTRSMVHRGPDDEGYFISGPLGLGFRRLSIIDIDGGHQPMSDERQTVWIVFNGEIYNFPELRKKLESFGHLFRTRSDTEVILHGYKQWGEDVFNHLNGMFGVAIWDVTRRKLILARDPMGIKLVYYRIDGGVVTFGSEIRPILAASNEKPGIDPTSLNVFMRYRYSPSPLTLYSGIRKLAPGSMLVFENGAVRSERWYRFRPTPFFPERPVDDVLEELEEIYRRSIRRHLISDVPLGLLLSGGIDSGLLLALMNLEGGSWPTFTVGYGEDFKDDELADASGTAFHFGSRHVSVHLDRDTFERTLPKIVSFLEEPVASSSIVPMYFVCQRARQDVKVALIGQGADELFGGYSRHLGVHYGEYWRGIPGWLRNPIRDTINRLPRSETLKRGVYSLSIADRMTRYQHVFSIVPGELIDDLFREDMLPADSGGAVLKCWEDMGDQIEGTDELGGFQYIEVRSSLPDELLMYADKLSMAHGLEARVPYLDRELVEYVQRISSGFKVRNGVRKWIHRQVCKKHLPKKVLARKKRGFAVNVVDDWFQHSLSGKLKSYLLDESSLMYKYLRPEKTKLLVDEHLAGRNDYHKVLFSMVMFEEWLRINS